MVGVEDLAVAVAGQAVAVEVDGAAGEGRAVLAVDLAVAVKVAGHADLEGGGAAAGQGQALQAGFGDAQQGGGFAAAAGLAEHAGAVHGQRGAQRGFDGIEDRARAADGLDGAGDFAASGVESKAHWRAGGQAAGPGIAGADGVGQPVGRAAQGYCARSVEQAAVGAIAQALVEGAVAEQAAGQHQAAGAVVAVDDCRVAAVGLAAGDALDAAGAVAFQADAGGRVSAADQGDAGIADQPLLAVGEADVLHLAAGVQQVADAARPAEFVVRGLPGQAGGAVEQALALGLQGGGQGGVGVQGGQGPTGKAAGEGRAQNLGRGGVWAQPFAAGAQLEAEVGRALGGVGQIDRCLQPDLRAQHPGSRRAQAVGAGLVVAEVGVEQWQRPIAEVTAGTRVQAAAERDVVIAQAPYRVGVAGLDQLFVG